MDEDEEFVEDDESYVDVCVGASNWLTRSGMFYVEKDYRVSGEVWRVHKGDADPFPSKPHAHCVHGASRFVGLKLHLGTARLYDGAKALDRYLEKKQFSRLIELIQPKFPQIKLPLQAR